MPLAGFGGRHLIVSILPGQREGTRLSSEREGLLYGWSTDYKQIGTEHYTYCCGRPSVRKAQDLLCKVL